MKKRFSIIAAVFLLALSAPIWSDTDTLLTISSIDIELKNDYPVNSFRDYYVTGLGTGVQANFDLNFTKDIGFFGAVDYIYGISDTIWVDLFQNLTVSTGLYYNFIISDSFTIIPEIGYGLCGHLLSGDLDRNGTDSSTFYLDQILIFSVKAAYTLNKKITVYISPEVKYCIEKENGALLAGYNLGTKINL